MLRLNLAGGELIRGILSHLPLHIDSTCSILGLFLLDLRSFLVYFNGCDLLVSFDASTLLPEFNLVVCWRFFSYDFSSLINHLDLFI